MTYLLKIVIHEKALNSNFEIIQNFDPKHLDKLNCHHFIIHTNSNGIIRNICPLKLL